MALGIIHQLLPSDYIKQKVYEKAGVGLIEVSDDFVWPNVRSKLEQAVTGMETTRYCYQIRPDLYA